MPSITGTLTNSGDSADLITATAGQSIQVWGLQIYVVESAITVTVKTGSTNKFTCAGVAGYTIAAEAGGGREPVIQGDKGEDLKINLSGSGQVRYNIQYALGGL